MKRHYVCESQLMRTAGMTRFRLEGKLKGDWVRKLERCWSTARNGHTEIQFFVELSNVDFVDEIGRGSAQPYGFSRGRGWRHVTIW